MRQRILIVKGSLSGHVVAGATLTEARLYAEHQLLCVFELLRLVV
jgi:hypothetical protein